MAVPEKEFGQHTHVIDLDEVLRFWSAEYKIKDEEILKIESYVDPVKGKAVFVINTKLAAPKTPKK